MTVWRGYRAFLWGLVVVAGLMAASVARAQSMDEILGKMGVADDEEINEAYFQRVLEKLRVDPPPPEERAGWYGGLLMEVRKALGQDLLDLHTSTRGALYFQQIQVAFLAQSRLDPTGLSKEQLQQLRAEYVAVVMDYFFRLQKVYYSIGLVPADPPFTPQEQGMIGNNLEHIKRGLVTTIDKFYSLPPEDPAERTRLLKLVRESATP